MLQPCMRIKCGAEAAYSIKALIPVVGQPMHETMPVEFFCGLRLCPACANRLKPQDIFTGDIRRDIRGMLMSQGSTGCPDFDRAQLVIISINDLQLLQLESHHATIH